MLLAGAFTSCVELDGRRHVVAGLKDVEESESWIYWRMDGKSMCLPTMTRALRALIGAIPMQHVLGSDWSRRKRVQYSTAGSVTVQVL